MKRSLREGVIVLAIGLGLGASLQIGAHAAQQPTGGQGGVMVFTEPSPFDFNDHQGYVSLFDGKSLKGWDGNPKFWRVEDGAILGESTPANPSGNSYIVYRDLVAKDFTLKFEIKIEGDGGSGIQYRSKTGLPWLADIPANVTANVGPVNLTG
jgi:3-keto-disaccharide hydrolase